MGEGMLQLFPLTESHIFLNERPFATRLQSCFSEKPVCPLASDISYRQAREGKQREQMRKGLFTTFSSLLFLCLTFSMEPLSVYAPSLLKAVSVCISVSIHYPSSHPSISGI